MRRLLPLLALFGLAGCTATTTAAPEADGVGGKADGVAAALEGTREGYAVLRLVNDGEIATFEYLDVTVGLYSRSAANLVAHRDGPDGAFGTGDDDLFESIEELDSVPWVGPSTLGTLADFAAASEYLPEDDELLGTFDGVDFTFIQGDRVLAFVNTATEDELDEANVPPIAVDSILEARPIATIAQLADLYWVGPRTLEHLLAATTPAAAERALCMDDADCAGGYRCTGRPSGYDYGKCADTTNYPGFQAPCEVDADCSEHHICIGQTVYGRGYCADTWMRDTFTTEVSITIPAEVMDEPIAVPLWVFGQASVPEDIVVTLDLDHEDPSSLWIGLDPPTGQGPVTVYDGATDPGPVPTEQINRSIYRDDAVNGQYVLLVQNVGGRGTGEIRRFGLQITSRFD